MNTEEKKNYILSEKKRGRTFEEIAKVLNVSKQRVQAIADSRKKEITNSRGYNLADEFVGLYIKGEVIDAIADKYKVSTATVSTWLRKKGVEVARRGPKKIKKERKQ